MILTELQTVKQSDKTKYLSFEVDVVLDRCEEVSGLLNDETDKSDLFFARFVLEFVVVNNVIVNLNLLLRELCFEFGRLPVLRDLLYQYVFEILFFMRNTVLNYGKEHCEQIQIYSGLLNQVLTKVHFFFGPVVGYEG